MRAMSQRDVLVAVIFGLEFISASHDLEFEAIVPQNGSRRKPPASSPARDTGQQIGVTRVMGADTACR